jgi:hypothetical protein
VIVADSRSGLLRQLADWLDTHEGDESFAGLVAEYIGLRSTR